MKGRKTICILIGILIFIPPAFGAGNGIKRFHDCCSNPAMEGWNKTMGGKMGDDTTWEFIKNGEEYNSAGSSNTYSMDGYDTWPIKASQLQLDIEIKGGFGITILIKNTGNETLYNLEFGIDMDGLVFMGRHTEGETSSLPPGLSIEIHLFVFGIGSATIRVWVGETYKTANLFIIGPLVMVEGT